MTDTEKLNEAADSGLLQPRLVRHSSYVVMKVMHGLYSEQWDIHCVCADRKTAKIECDHRNARSRTNSYFVKRVPFLPNVRPLATPPLTPQDDAQR